MGKGVSQFMRLVWLCLAVALLAGCGGGGGDNPPSNPTPPPTPVTLTSLNPAALNAGAGATVLTVTGTGFTSSSVVEWNGAALTTQYVSSTSLTATIPPVDLAAPGTVAVTVSSGSTSVANSAVVDFTVSEQMAPTIASLSPNTALATSPSFLLVVVGTNFQVSAVVYWNGLALPTQYTSPTQVVAQVGGAQLKTAGTVSVMVQNDSAAGGSSNVISFTITPLPPPPTLVSLSPTSIRQNQGNVTLTLTGTNFTPSSQVSTNGGVFSGTTSYVSSTQLTYSFTTTSYSPAAGSPLTLTVYDSASGNINSNTLSLPVGAALPSISGLTPSTIYADQGALKLTVAGQFLTATTTVYLNGSPRPTTVDSQNGGQLAAQLSATDVASAGTLSITVADSASGNIASAPATLTIQPLPALAFSALSPTAVPAGSSDFTLTVVGNGFTVGSVIALNGAALPTTFKSLTSITASVTAAQVANLGTLQISVINPANEGGTTASLPLNVVPRSKDAVSYQIDNGHSGSITFNSVSLPGSSAWSVNVGGSPSSALIVANRVYVMVSANGNSQLLALNATTGATVWGPMAFGGAAGVTYDNGTLFVNSGAYIAGGIVTAVDATTGAMKWSSKALGGFISQTAPVAAQGVVYILDLGALAAYDETTGAQLWVQYPSGTDGSVAVSLDGVYVSAPCTAVDYNPLTGAQIWYTNTGCEGGGGSTPVVASGRFYAPIANWFTGNVYDAKTGGILGAFNYNVPPAVSATHAFVMANSTLQGITLSNNQINWSFAGDGTLTTPPISVNNYVFVGSSSGNLYALNADTGAQVWTQNLGAAIPGGYSYQGVTGLSAGDGLLVVPAGNTVTAYVLSTNP